MANYSTLIMLINENIRAVKCIYDTADDAKADQKEYLFKTLDTSIVIGDLVVVPSKTRHKRTIVKVVEVDTEVDYDSEIQVEWIVGKVNNADYAAIKKIEDEAIEKIKSAEKLRKKQELRDKLLNHDNAMIAGLQIASMTALPGATPEDTKAESITTPYTYQDAAKSPVDDVDF